MPVLGELTMPSIQQHDTDMLRCSKCHRTLPVTQFYKRPNRKRGYTSKCKWCFSIYRKKNKEHYRLYANGRYNTDPEYRKRNITRTLAWQRRNATQVTAREEAYWDTHPVLYWATYVLSNHRAKGHTVVITTKQLEQKALSVESCELCGCKLDWSRKKGRPLPNSPSLDRKHNERTVTQENILITCFKCGVSKQNRTLEEFVKYCAHVAARFPRLQVTV